MKKIISILLVATMLLTSCALFTSCGQPEETFKVGAIYIGSQNEASGYTFAHANGIKTAIEAIEKSKNVKVELYVQDNVAEDNTAVENALNNLASDGCEIIFGISFGYVWAFDKAAQTDEFADIVLSHATGFRSSLDTLDTDYKNPVTFKTEFNNYFGRIYQARYLAGIAAGLKSLDINNNNIGYVAAYGTEYAETCSGINAFALGAMSVNPNANVLVKKINTWGDELKEQNAANELATTYQCGVIAQHCDSNQPQIVAAQNNIFGCGYNSDMTSAETKKSHLTAPIWHWDVYYKLAIETAMNDKANFMTVVGNYFGGLKDGFVDISPLNEEIISETAAAKIAAAKKAMIDGTWDVFSGFKLTYTENADKTFTATPVEAALETSDGAVVRKAGEASIDDGVIKGSMDYFIKGVYDITVGEKG